MPEKIQLTLNVSVQNGPHAAVTQTLEVAIYEKAQVMIPAAGTGTTAAPAAGAGTTAAPAAGTGTTAAPAPGTATVKLHPDALGPLRFLLITASTYGPTPAPLTYSIDNDPEKTLDSSLLLCGAGAVSLLGSGPLTFEFRNRTGINATVEILIGRDAP